MRRSKKPTEKAVGTRVFNGVTYLILIVVCIISLFPIIYVIFGSFKSNMEFLTAAGKLLPESWNPVNYINAWQTANFARYSLNSVIVTLCAIAGAVLLTSMAGYVFARGDFPGKKLIMGMFLGAMFLATGAITIYPIFSLAKGAHLNTSLWGLIIIYIFTIDVSQVYLVMGYVKGLPRELDEAARIDGCGFFQTFLRVILPLCKPILATVALLTFKTVWNDYLKPMVFTLGNDNMKTLTVGVVSLKSSGGGAGAYDIMLAGTAISLIPMILFYCFTSRFFVSGITAGAVKG